MLALALLAPGVTVLCSTAFGGLLRKADKDHPSTVAVLFVDVSLSTYGPHGAERRQYAAAIDRIVHALPGDTLLKGDLIDSNPLAHTTLPVSEYFEKYNFFKTSRFKLKRQRDRAIAEFAPLLSEQLTGDSILDALSLAQKVFNSYRSATTKYLVIFSDMIETSGRYRFTDANLQTDRVKAFIASDAKAGRLPSLKRVNIYVVGAGATQGGDAKPAHIRAVEQFWFQYFAAAGADLSADRYAPALIRFP